MKLHFKISDFCISDDLIPKKIADKILKWHLMPLQKVRNLLNANIVSAVNEKEIKVWASKKSSFRPYWWEIDRKRSGLSQHCFGQKKSAIIYKDEKGATDVTCSDFRRNKDNLLEALISETDYTRFAVYKTFVHCDYKNREGTRQLFSYNRNDGWKFIKNI